MRKVLYCLTAICIMAGALSYEVVAQQEGRDSSSPRFSENTVYLLHYSTMPPVLTPRQYLPFISKTTLPLPQAEYEALVALYTSTHGENWFTNEGWLSESHPCSWYGVGCDSGHVTQLSLPGNNLNGRLPANIGDLSHLQRLDLQARWVSATNGCKSFYMESREIRGAIRCPNNIGNPAREIGDLTELQFLNLTDLSITELPSEIGKLSSLQYLILSDNELSTLPSEIGNLSSLRSLALYRNQLTSLPPEIGNLSGLMFLYLLGNQLQTIPPEIGSLGNLVYLDMYDNQLSTLPRQIGLLSKLESLSLGSNHLTSLPIELTQLTQLVYLNVFDNHLISIENPDLFAFLDRLNPGWQNRQTPP